MHASAASREFHRCASALPILLACALLAACGQRRSPETTAPEAEAAADAGTRTTSARDYSELFSLAEGACPFLTADEVATALDIPAGNVEAKGCRYVITLADGSKSPIVVRTGEMPRAEVRRAIDDLRNDTTGLLAAVPDASGDNVLAIHKPRGWLTIYNPGQDRYLQLDFGTVVFAAAHKEVQVTDRVTARENAQRVANALIARYAR